ncbi:MAG: glycoside hydrolase family 3 N-terminal domain-containing protein [Cyanobacteria bacterium P01_A01_bin.84]
MSTSLSQLHFGNHLLVGISGPELNDADKRLLGDLKPVGIVFYGKNFLHNQHYEVWLESFQQLNAQIREYAERDAMFMTIDHEGGRVIRPPLPISRFPYTYFQRNRATSVAKAMAVELKSLGINLSWSPVADIFSNPTNPIIGPRAFDITPEAAGKGAVEFFQGLRESGIIACAKHFPGHGDTSTDSHLELPVLYLTLEELRSRELIPFQMLIKENIPMIMTAHILFPKIDRDVPGTLSKTILQKLLREELGFQGVVVSDDLDMKAVSDMYAQGGTVTKTFHAGCDLLMVSGNLPGSSLEKTYAIASDFASSLNDGSLDESVVEASRVRVESLLNITPQYPVEMLDKDSLLKHAELAIDCSFDK